MLPCASCPATLQWAAATSSTNYHASQVVLNLSIVGTGASADWSVLLRSSHAYPTVHWQLAHIWPGNILRYLHPHCSPDIALFT
jgi:hypothetical protein